MYQHIDPVRDNILVLAHELGHDIWPGGGGGHLDPLSGNGVPAAGAAGPISQADRYVAHGLMISDNNSTKRFYGIGPITSAAERFHANPATGAANEWISCTTPVSGQTYTLADAELNDGCVRLPLGMATDANGRSGTRSLFFSNVQRSGYLNQTYTQPVNPGDNPLMMPCSTCIDAEGGLATTGLMVEAVSDAQSNSTGYWSRDIVPADNRLTYFTNALPICDLAAGQGQTLDLLRGTG